MVQTSAPTRSSLNPETAPGKPPARSLSLRVLLVGLLIGAAAYVGLFCAIIVFRIVPSVRDMKSHSHTAMATWTTRNDLDTTLQLATSRIRGLLLRQTEGAPPSQAEILAVVDTVRGYADRSWVRDAARAFAKAPMETRVALARAMSAESGAINAVLDAATDVELGRVTQTAHHLVRADSLRHLAVAHLLAIEKSALMGAFNSERDVGVIAEAAGDLVWWWAIAGLLLGFWFLVVVHQRLNVPLALLERGLDRVTAGDLSVVVPIKRRDEVGRLTQHLNNATAVLRDRTEEERLRAHNLSERLGRVLDESWNEILICDAVTLHIRQVNQGALKNLGWEPSELERHTLLDLLPEFDPESFAALLEPLRDGRERRIVLTTVHLRSDGTTYPVEMNLQLSTREAPPVFVAIVQDLTSRVRIEAELNRIFDLSADLLVTGTLDGRLTRVNPAWVRTLGYSQEEPLRRPFADFVHPDDLPQLEAVLAGLARGAAAREFTLRLRHRNGGYRWISWNCDPPADGILYGVGRDVTDRKEAEAKQHSLGVALERAAREWSMTFDAITDPVMVVSATGTLVRINEAARAATGQTHASVLGRPPSSIGSDPLWRRTDALAAQVRATGSPTSTQISSTRWRRTWDLDGVPVIRDGELQAVIVIAHDITALSQLQESLRRSETMAAMGALVAGVAHEVRNPLFSMTATLDAFEARHRDRPRDEPHLDILRNQLGRLQQLMRDLLEYGKPPTLELTSLDLGEVVRQAAEANAAVVQESGVTLRILADPGLPPAQGDRLRLTQVFGNLIVNGIQHSPRWGEVTVTIDSLHQDGRHWLEARVADQGPGFTADSLPHVFEPFYTRRRGGTGLGLALVQRIVEQHSGRVTAENCQTGGGLVRVRLPLAPN
jgi:PAS domain S-box-containing protein